MAYYLEHHDLAPDQEFLAYIRGRGYQLPERLPSMTKARALAAATDAPDEAPGFDGEWELAMRWVDSSVRQFQIDPARFSVGSDREPALCLTRQEDRWSVYWLYQGERQMYAEFDTPLQAVTYFSGYLAMYGSNMRLPPPAT
ncbi:hypothetical protein [Lentzea sp. E54]|uniref:hypothetical protein n=1 Tax=Lentzea xerophila TaxID=3435883 RepID=UPI003DA4F4DC